MTSAVQPLKALDREGMTREEIESLIDSGQFQRVKRGWVASPLASSRLLEAIKAGGRLGCLSGCAEYGLWTPPHSATHVIVSRGVPRLRENWHRHIGKLPEEALFPLEDCLLQVVRHHDAETALMVLESALHKELLEPNAAQVIAATGVRRKQHLLAHLDSGAESGLETRVRLFVQRHRYRVQTQVQIAGVGRVDMLVGQSLIIECDGDEHHRDPQEDRRRDLAAKRLGYRVVRLSYEQIMTTWDDASTALLAVLKTGEHLLPPVPLPNPT